MYKALVYCRAGRGTSLMLKIKADQVIEANDFPIETVHGSREDLKDFDGDLIISTADLADDLKADAPYVVTVDDILDKEAIKKGLEGFLAWAKEQGLSPDKKKKRR